MGLPWRSGGQDFHCQGPHWIPGGGTKIPHAAWHGQNKRKKKTKIKLGNSFSGVIYIVNLINIDIHIDKGIHLGKSAMLRVYCETLSTI